MAFLSRCQNLEIQSALLRATETLLGSQHSLAQCCSEEEAGLGTRGSGGREAREGKGRVAGGGGKLRGGAKLRFRLRG